MGGREGARGGMGKVNKRNDSAGGGMEREWKAERVGEGGRRVDGSFDVKSHTLESTVGCIC